MYQNDEIYMGLADGQKVTMKLNMSNRHGLIAGASGTGKTITMKVMAESFSDAGVPVFLCDVKGDVSGLAMPGEFSDSMEDRIEKFGLDECFDYKAYPVSFWDIYQEKGHPVRVTVSDMGPDLLSKILGLTPAQEVHHILPLSRGGTHEDANLMALCKPCHSEITARDGDRWHTR